MQGSDQKKKKSSCVMLAIEMLHSIIEFAASSTGTTSWPTTLSAACTASKSANTEVESPITSLPLSSKSVIVSRPKPGPNTNFSSPRPPVSLSLPPAPSMMLSSRLPTIFGRGGGAVERSLLDYQR